MDVYLITFKGKGLMGRGYIVTGGNEEAAIMHAYDFARDTAEKTEMAVAGIVVKAINSLPEDDRGLRGFREIYKAQVEIQPMKGLEKEVDATPPASHQ